MSDGAANQLSSIRRISQVPHEAGSIVGRAPSNFTKSIRVGSREDQAAHFGLGGEANCAGKVGH
jgi:hypothetical protein